MKQVYAPVSIQLSIFIKMFPLKISEISPSQKFIKYYQKNLALFKH